MSATYRIKVGREHIDRGDPGFKDTCPIALAVADAVPGATDVFVDDYRINLVAGCGRLVAYMPTVAVEFIRDFDMARSREGFVPFEFEAVFNRPFGL